MDDSKASLALLLMPAMVIGMSQLAMSLRHLRQKHQRCCWRDAVLQRFVGCAQFCGLH